MKKYFIGEFVICHYSTKRVKAVKCSGVLADCVGKRFTRDEIDKIICEMIMRHPYIEGAMSLRLSVQWRDGNVYGFYHIFDFENDNYKLQHRGSPEIKYEK